MAPRWECAGRERAAAEFSVERMTDRYRELYDGSAADGELWAPARVLVTDGETRAALACVRALAARGHTVHVAASGPRSLAGASRYAAGAHDVGDPSSDPRGFAERLARVGARTSALDVILPVTEVTLGSIYAFDVAASAARSCARSAPPTRSPSTSTSCCDRAAQLGLAVPRMRLFEDPAQLTALPEPFSYPVVLKPRRSRFLSEGRWVAGEVRIVRTTRTSSSERALRPESRAASCSRSSFRGAARESSCSPIAVARSRASRIAGSARSRRGGA